MIKKYKLISFVLILLYFFNVFAIKNREEVILKDCVDGDTAKFVINNKVEVVRFLSIDTPESVKPDSEVELFGKEASEYTCNMLKNAKKIFLEYDPKSDKKDKYDRVLAYVFVDDILLEKELVKNGLAEVAYVYDDYLYIDELKKEEEKAKKNKIGIWSNSEEKIIDNQDDENIIIEIFNLIVDFVRKILDMIFS